MHTATHRTLSTLRITLFALGAALGTPGCMSGAADADTPADRVASTAQSISGGTVVSSNSGLALATVGIQGPNSRCTGVLISRRHVLTAAHCEFTLVPASSVVVTFYRGPLPEADTVTATKVEIRPGVNLTPGLGWNGLNNDDLQDVNDKFADIALITLSADAPSYTRPAYLPISYPGNNVSGSLVGTGNHDGMLNSYLVMRYLLDTTYSSDNNDGHFLLNTANVNGGDSGGPFYSYVDGHLVVHGVLFGTDIEWALHAKYTSVQYHLSWLLARMSYTGGMTTSTNTWRTGGLAGVVFTTDPRVCALACAQSSLCTAYAHVGTVCNLLSSVTATSTISGATSGVK